MELRPLPADEEAVRRYTEELWLPYHRALEAAVDAHELVDDIDALLSEEVAFRLERLESADYRAWVAVDGEEDDETPFADVDGDLAGFIATSIDQAPPVFDRPDRLCIGDIYVREPYRDTGLARELVDRAVRRARETDCVELTLEVDADNERALAFYERLGFETHRYQLTVPVADV